VRLAALACELKPHRTFGKPPEPKPAKPVKPMDLAFKPADVRRARSVGD